MTTIKMKHFFNLTLTCLTISLMASALFAESVKAGSAYGIDEVVASHRTSTPECLLSRDVIQARIDKALVKSGFHSKAIYGIYSFEHELGMTTKDINAYFDDVEQQLGFTIPVKDRAKITHNQALLDYASRAANTNCTMEADAQ